MIQEALTLAQEELMASVGEGVDELLLLREVRLREPNDKGCRRNVRARGWERVL